MSPRTRRGPDRQVSQRESAGQFSPPQTTTLLPSPWPDYELIDSGGGSKLERFGTYRLVRPDAQAIWEPALTDREWQQADAHFQKGRGEDGPGEWLQRRKLPEQWRLQHEGLAFWVRLTPFRHTGIFPEHSAHWQWMREHLTRLAAHRQPRVLVLFGYTGLYALVAAQAGAAVCHVDASRPATRWAQANQEASGLQDRPIRWIVDDAEKFVRREIRRGSQYELIIMDPPVFGRGPKGEIWRLNEALQPLVHDCTQLLSDQAAGVLISAYATSISPLTLANVLGAALQQRRGATLAGELVLQDTSRRRPLPAALYARWTAAE
jgi:23S rRNA (cytosine1962-C5)-methyltransferase